MPAPSQPPVRIGTRASKLALAQAGLVQQAVARALGGRPEDAPSIAPLVTFTTSADRIQDRRLAEIGGKGLFTREIEEALAQGRIDCAAHSLKDMPAEPPTGLVIGAVPEREDPRDVFLSPAGDALADLPAGAVLGTASLRRRAQTLFKRPDVRVELLRGNVDTRLAKLDAGQIDAIILARAGLVRLGLARLARSPIDPVEAPPAPGQGALAIQVRAAEATAPWLAGLSHLPSLIAVTAERGALAALEGSCKTAVGAYARVEGGWLKLVVEALTPDGSRRFRREGEVAFTGGVTAALDLGRRLGEAVRREGGSLLGL